MAIAHNASNIDYLTSAAILDVDVTVSGTPSDVVGVAAIGTRSSTAKTFTSVTWDYGGSAPQAMTIVGDETVGNARGGIAYIIDPTTKTGTITVRLVISANARIMLAPAVYSGADGASLGASTFSNTGTNLSDTATGVGSDDWVVGSAIFEDGASNQTTPDTQRQQDQTGASGTNMEMMLLDDDGSGGGSVTLTVNGSASNKDKTISLLVLEAAGGAGPTGNPWYAYAQQ